MKKYYTRLERLFDLFSERSLSVFGNSITFLIVCIIVVYWIIESILMHEQFHDLLRDCLLGISFLNFFIIQKSVNRYSKALHLKLDELVFTNEKASNEIVNAEKKTEDELEEMRRKYDENKSVE